MQTWDFNDENGFQQKDGEDFSMSMKLIFERSQACYK